MKRSITKFKLFATIIALFFAVWAFLIAIGCSFSPVLNIKNQHYNSENTPVVLHITGDNFETYHAVNSSEEKYPLNNGNYKIEIIGEITNNGESYYYSDKNIEVKGETEFDIGSGVKDEWNYSQTETNINKLKDAIKYGDETIGGDIGQKYVDKAEKIFADYKYRCLDHVWHFGTYVTNYFGHPNSYKITIEYRDGGVYALYDPSPGKEEPVLYKVKSELGFSNTAFRLERINKDDVPAGWGVFIFDDFGNFHTQLSNQTWVRIS